MRSANIDQFELHDAARSQHGLRHPLSLREQVPLPDRKKLDGPPEFVGESTIQASSTTMHLETLSVRQSAPKYIKGTAESTAVGYQQV